MNNTQLNWLGGTCCIIILLFNIYLNNIPYSWDGVIKKVIIEQVDSLSITDGITIQEISIWTPSYLIEYYTEDQVPFKSVQSTSIYVTDKSGNLKWSTGLDIKPDDKSQILTFINNALHNKDLR